MGLLDEIGKVAGEFGGNAAQPNAPQGNSAQPKVASGFLQALEQHPGGIASVLGALRQNGLGQHVDAWTQGQQQPVAPEQVGQALGGTGLIEQTAQRAGVSPQVATMALAALLPVLMKHLAPGGQPSPQQNYGGLAQQILGKFL
jgi:uncharacterized protein YidB (DUF937 family)